MQCSIAPLRLLDVTGRTLLLGLLAATTFVVACGSPELASDARPAPPQTQPPAKRLGGSAWNIDGFDSRPGEPFEITLVTSSLEVINDTLEDVSPVCVLTYGSQVALIDTADTILPPSSQAWLTGTSEFPRPLDDYESNDAACFTRLPASISRDIEREQRLLTVGRTTLVPNLVGERLDARLGNFRRGLDISIVKEKTPCTKDFLMRMSRSVDPFGKPPCAAPVIVDQYPEPGSSAVVGDEISVTVVATRNSPEQRDAK